MNGKETLKCNQIIYKEDLVRDPDFSDYMKDQLDSYVGGKIMSRLLGNGECICRAITKVEQFADINAVNIMDTVQITKLIRCKDCKNWDTDWQTIEGQHYCPMVDQQTLGDFFCADGERREE